MADVATPSAAAISTIDAGAEPPSKATKQRPEKPNEDLFKEALRQAEEAHAAVQQKYVSSVYLPLDGFFAPTACLSASLADFLNHRLP